MRGKKLLCPSPCCLRFQLLTIYGTRRTIVSHCYACCMVITSNKDNIEMAAAHAHFRLSFGTWPRRKGITETKENLQNLANFFQYLAPE